MRSSHGGGELILQTQTQASVSCYLLLTQGGTSLGSSITSGFPSPEIHCPLPSISLSYDQLKEAELEK